MARDGAIMMIGDGFGRSSIEADPHKPAKVLLGMTILGGIGAGFYLLFSDAGVGGLPFVSKVFHRERADGVDPRIQAFLDDWNANGPFPIKIVFGIRTLAQQQALWAEGRDPNDPGTSATTSADYPPHKGNVVDPSAIVTEADSNVNSAHGHGGAIDAYPTDAAGLSAVTEYTSASAAQFQEYGRRAVAAGLVWGGNWATLKDYGHVETPDWQSLPVVS